MTREAPHDIGLCPFSHFSLALLFAPLSLSLSVCLSVCLSASLDLPHKQTFVVNTFLVPLFFDWGGKLTILGAKSREIFAGKFVAISQFSQDPYINSTQIRSEEPQTSLSLSLSFSHSISLYRSLCSRFFLFTVSSVSVSNSILSIFLSTLSSSLSILFSLSIYLSPLSLPCLSLLTL